MKTFDSTKAAWRTHAEDKQEQRASTTREYRTADWPEMQEKYLRHLISLGATWKEMQNTQPLMRGFEPGQRVNIGDRVGILAGYDKNTPRFPIVLDVGDSLANYRLIALRWAFLVCASCGEGRARSSTVRLCDPCNKAAKAKRARARKVKINRNIRARLDGAS